MRRHADVPRTAASHSVEPDVVTASGVYRALIILLAVWTFFAGLALATQGVPALSVGGENAAERIIGAQMLMVVPVYGLIVWRPDEYRLLRWIPYAAQLAIILPMFWDVLITGDQAFQDGALLFIITAVFLGALVYVRVSTHPLDFFSPGDDEEAVDEEDEELLDEDDASLDEDEDPDPEPEPQGRGRRYRKNT